MSDSVNFKSSHRPDEPTCKAESLNRQDCAGKNVICDPAISGAKPLEERGERKERKRTK